MQAGSLEHVNITVRDAEKTAALLCKLFDWKVRWSGPALNDGTTYHVGTDRAYIAVYEPKTIENGEPDNKNIRAGMNHIGVIVDDIDNAEARVVAAGLVPKNHGDYEPGRRFYFRDHDDIEFEVVSYT